MFSIGVRAVVLRIESRRDCCNFEDTVKAMLRCLRREISLSLAVFCVWLLLYMRIVHIDARCGEMGRSAQLFALINFVKLQSTAGSYVYVCMHVYMCIYVYIQI